MTDPIQTALQSAKEDVAIYGESLDTFVFAEFVNAEGDSDIRAFQWARKGSRVEFDKLTSWCIKNKRMMRVIPFSMIGEIAA